MLLWILWRWMSKSQKFIETAGARTRFALHETGSHAARSAATNAANISAATRLATSRPEQRGIGTQRGIASGASRAA